LHARAIVWKKCAGIYGARNVSGFDRVSLLQNESRPILQRETECKRDAKARRFRAARAQFR
jgi:hypothetical protein